MVRAIQLKNATSGVQQGGCSSSPDKPLSFAFWTPAGPLVLKKGLYTKEGTIVHNRGHTYSMGEFLVPEVGP